MMSKNPKTYLDYAATTPLDPRVFDVMGPFFTSKYGNPSSVHTFGQQAEAAVETARESLAEFLNCSPMEVVFTSCGSESDNLALRGAAFAARQIRKANHILISLVEHHAISHTAEQLSNVFGFDLEYLPVNEYGQVTGESVKERLREDTAVVSIMFANNEIGSINPIREIGEICRGKNIPFHTDAVQAAAHLAIDTSTLNVDLLSLGAHKLYGPKGIGALYIRQGTPILTTQTGGGQENNFRAGTSNVAFIVGQAEAFRLSKEEQLNNHAHLIPLRDRLIKEVLQIIPDVKLTGHPTDRLPNHASFVFKNVGGNELLMMLDNAGFACSSGSACKTGNPEPSEVLNAIGLSRDWGLGSLRVTLGKYTKDEDISRFIEILPQLISDNRKMRGF
ncbi:MAG: cysteine desulfurase [Chloroflexi bacterium]|nr:cysteine desulfurase [Chloroflexota bacterium]MBT3669472.1 cysteine desulfurase [Chloroflexota bacterium]MBT4003250.1 cysteine desulfurase [Chloroflexota bacterium]MBT4304509.1 cysteine desulfurase [Chloroflexota bacterium]MBT4534150.1 cysteine desulfurase [Chloroflexota bacterium]